MIRSVLLYLLLVGFPVAGMSAVLRAGRDLKPPASFGGSWRVEAWPDSVCPLSQPDTLQLVIEQSGPGLSIKTRRGPRFTGQVSGASFAAQGPNGRRMTGHRIASSGPTQFEGIVTGAPCDRAVATRIRATRVHLPADLTGH
jgi:hypothetical protein